MINKEKKYLVIFGISFLLFLLVMIFVLSNSNNNLDNNVFKIVSMFHFPLGIKLMEIITNFANPAVALVLAFLLSIKKIYNSTNRLISLGMFSFFMGGGVVFATIIKMIVKRHRPKNQLIFDGGYSFPSIHTIAAVLLVGLIMYFVVNYFKEYESKAIIFGFCWIIIVAFSRIYLQNHFFTDTIAAMLLGISWVSLSMFCWNVVKQKFLK